jgi:hypothetical protein
MGRLDSTPPQLSTQSQSWCSTLQVLAQLQLMDDSASTDCSICELIESLVRKMIELSAWKMIELSAWKMIELIAWELGVECKPGCFRANSGEPGSLRRDPCGPDHLYRAQREAWRWQLHTSS